MRDSGLESHCAINLNKTHVFIAGGFAKAYYFQDNAADKIQRNKLDPLGDGIDLVNQGRAKPRRGRRQAGIGGGYSLKSAWIYDGNHWNRISDLQVPRDRPACSVMTKEDGSIRILVTGGCEGWCVKNIQQLDNIFMAPNKSEDIDFSHGLFPEVESISIHNISGDVNDLDSEGLA